MVCRWLPGTLLLAFSALRTSESWTLPSSWRSQAYSMNRFSQSIHKRKVWHASCCKIQPFLCRLSSEATHNPATHPLPHLHENSNMRLRRPLTRQPSGTMLYLTSGHSATDATIQQQREDDGSFVDFDDDLKEQGLSALLYACQHLEPSWRIRLKGQFRDKSFFRLAQSLKDEVKVQKYTVYPPPHLIFNAFQMTPFDRVRVRIPTHCHVWF
jgi:hypothetical protein